MNCHNVAPRVLQFIRGLSHHESSRSKRTPMNLSETAEVLAAISELRRRGASMSIATIVSVRGSTYRRPGARLLVPQDGEAVGNLSGGCLEGQVTEIARDVMRSGEPRLEFYDLT